MNEAKKLAYLQQFMDYAHLVGTMSNEELAREIGERFSDDTYQAAIVLVLLTRIIVLENKSCN